MLSSVLTVSQVNTFLKSLIDSDGRLQDFFISGEISNFTNHYKSGHLYLSLKDEKSVIKAVMFAKSAKQLKFTPENGMKVIARGRVSIYEPTGQYQLYIQDLQPDGIGALSLAFEQLKLKLQNEGLFEASHKQSLPKYPDTIAVITSPTGAAVRDIQQIMERRWPMASILLCPVLVQGADAPAQLIAAVRKVNASNAADVIILGRGGGSLEDLAAFNNEELAREVFASKIPVVSAVGHETDFCITDFAADLRAPTPSAAAELCTPDIREEMLSISSMQRRIERCSIDLIDFQRQRLDFLIEASPLSAPEKLLAQQREKISSLTMSVEGSVRNRMTGLWHCFELLNEKLDSLSPLRILARGFSLCHDENEKIIRSVKHVIKEQKVRIRVSDGSFYAKVEVVGE